MQINISINLAEGQKKPKGIRIIFDDAPEKNFRALATLRRIREIFPDSIGKYAPLKIGIHSDLNNCLPELEPHEIEEVLTLHTETIDYQKALASLFTWRVDLDGQAVSQVTVSERLHAQKKLEELSKQ